MEYLLFYFVWLLMNPGLLLIWLLMAVICAMIAGSRRGGGTGVLFFFYGFLLWPIALVHALLLERADGPAEDAPEQAQATGGVRRPCRVAVDLVYEGEDGARSERYVEGYTLIERPAPKSVRLKHGEDAKRLYLQGFCQLKQGLRTFRVDRIRELVDAETGEVAEDPGTWLSARALERSQPAS